MDKVIAVVVTYNRKALLAECITAIGVQSVKPIAIVVVDNCSTDGTDQYLQSIQNCGGSCKVIHHRMSKNIGGAGGFYEGMKYAVLHYGYCHMWLMDDDTIPESSCLCELLAAKREIHAKLSDERISYLASNVLAANRVEMMNVPAVDTRPSMNGYPTFNRLLGCGVIKVRESTFVSILVMADAVRMCGLPCRDYFIWGDDSEYTLRLTKHFGTGYLVGKSVAIHKRAGGSNIGIRDEKNPNRVKLYYYYYRNNVINRFVHCNQRMTVRSFLGAIRSFVSFLPTPCGLLKFMTATRGIFDGTFRKNELVTFIRSQIKAESK